MKNFKISLDRQGYSEKPKDYEVGEISIRVGNNPVSVNPNNIGKIVDAIAAKGHTFSPATFFEGLRRASNFKQMQLFALDFDGGISLWEVMERSKEYDLPILFCYETLTSKNQSKFRTVYINDSSVSDIRLAAIIQNALMTIFPEADAHCNDVSRMYFGGKRLLHFEQALPTINLESTLRNMTYYLKRERGPTHYKKHLKKFAYKHKIRLNQKGLLDISIVGEPIESIGTSDQGKNSPTSILFKTILGEVLPKLQYQIALDDGCTRSSVERKKSRNHSEHRSSVLKNISCHCQLYKEFESGDRKLHHNELFGISTNIIHIETGVDVFKKILLSNPEYYENNDRWDFYLKYNKKTNTSL